MRPAGGRHAWPLPDGISGDAIFSEDWHYRWVLGRAWSEQREPVAVFVGLNPSTATSSLDDPTVRKCWRWAKTWGFASMRMLNAFAYRATDPTELTAVADPIGAENDEYLVRFTSSAALVVAAWGTRAGARGAAVRELLAGITPLHCLGTTANGSPWHPLYLPNTTQPVPWT